jgi:GNAT superfamily N-acetyltransferase
MFTVREIHENDLEQVTSLVAQLGYISTEKEVRERFQIIQGLTGHKIFVAVNSSNNTVGWIHVLKFPTLEMSLATELGGLVVDSSVRGQGVGKLLMAAAEKWSLDAGFGRLQFTSQMKRTDAHVFYKKLGYQIIKNSYYFSKDL